MSETEEKEFSIEGMLDSKREVAEKFGFIEEQRDGLIKKMIMACYKKEFVKKYALSSLTWSPGEEKYLLKWRRRLEFEELDDETYEKEYGMFLKKK